MFDGTKGNNVTQSQERGEASEVWRVNNLKRYLLSRSCKGLPWSFNTIKVIVAKFRLEGRGRDLQK